jgi:hypothetical protein
MQFARRRWIIVVLSCGGLFSLLLTGLWIEPFAEQFEGKTVREWISICMDDGTALNDRLVMGFGDAATPPLLARVRGIHSTSRAIAKIGSDRFRSFVLKKLRFRDKQLVVTEWLALLHFLGEPVLGPLCELEDYSSVMLIVSHVDDPTLNLYRQQQTNSFLRMNAENEHRSRWSSGVLRVPGAFQNFEKTLEGIRETRSAVAEAR